MKAGRVRSEATVTARLKVSGQVMLIRKVVTGDDEDGKKTVQPDG